MSGGMSENRPGRDRRAVRHRGRPGAADARGRRVAVVGGGIAGLASATALAERGVAVTLVESTGRLGGRVAAWPLPDGRTMSRGFHAFFRQYYNLRALLRRVDPELRMLTPVADYPLQRPDGPRDSFAGLPRTPPWSVLRFVQRNPAFTPAALARVNVPAALELMRVRFPETYSRYDGESAAAFLDRLRFPAGARDLALEVFARSFFADPREFGAGELVAMFHSYFIGSAEGLLFDVPRDDYDSALWAPLGDYLGRLGVEIVTGARVDGVALGGERASISVDGSVEPVDAVVLAADPRAARGIVAGLDAVEAPGFSAWQDAVAAARNAPPFVVVRLWLDRLVAPDRPAFLGTSGYGRLDNVSVLERFEAGASAWASGQRGSVVELHAYACDPGVLGDAAASETVVRELEEQLHAVYPETTSAAVIAREVLVRDDCPLSGTDPWAARAGVRTPSPQLMLAGDWVRCDYPVALMERAATTGFLAANALLEGWGAAGHDLWTAPMTGLLARGTRPAARVRRPGG